MLKVINLVRTKGTRVLNGPQMKKIEAALRLEMLYFYAHGYLTGFPS